MRTITSSIREVEGRVLGHRGSAIEEQSATTAEIARNVTQTSQAAQEVATRIARVSDEATETGSRAERGAQAVGRRGQPASISCATS